MATNQSEVGRMHNSRYIKCLRVYEKSRLSHCQDCPLDEGEQLGAGAFPLFCCSETRVAECTLVLTKHQLYPNERVLNKGPVAETVRQLNMVRETRTHKCDFDQHFHLRKRLGELEKAVVDASEGIRGQKLRPLTANESMVKSEDEDQAN